MIAVKCIASSERESDEITYGFIAHSIESFIKFGTTVDTEVAEIVQLFKEKQYTPKFSWASNQRALPSMPYPMVPLRCGRLRIEKTNYACYLIIIWNVFWFAIRTIPRSLPIILLHSSHYSSISPSSLPEWTAGSSFARSGAVGVLVL